MDTKVIGKNVLTLRKEKKVTQEQLANLERGEAENISDDIIRKLAWGLEVSFEQLTGKPNETSGTVIPPALREFAIKEGLPFEIVDTLLKIPLRGKNPTSAKEWKELYDAIKPYILGK